MTDISKMLENLPRYAPDSWGQMLKIRIGDVWDEAPTHLYLREQDVLDLFHKISDKVKK